MVKPIRPEDVGSKKREIFPDFVIEAFNNIIAKNYSEGRAEFKKNEVIDEILRLAQDESLTRAKVFDEKWLNVEEIFREEGWKVSYDTPGYNESYEGFYIFKSK